MTVKGNKYFDTTGLIEFIRQMTGIGMSENEAKAYYAVFMLKSATVRDVYEISGIPRNKIYQVLSTLEERGFVSQTKSRPIRYTAAEMKTVFDRLRREAVSRYDAAEEYLRSLYLREPVDIRPQIHELQSEWAIETHIKPLLRRTKNELILIIRDTEYGKKQIPETVLKRLSKKLSVYPILLNPESSEGYSIPCYRFRKDEPDSEKLHPFILQNTVLVLISDRKSLINIQHAEGRLFATILYLDEAYSFVSYLFEPIIKSLVPISPHH